ncbi:LADA_0F14576g1_1 [Lachancea dasiensis]|uniref:LADA_0F14576g1_1 n=1 Tax=Lachancea dasiensis TaxID=1072105 RepID=A0A1G4JNQ9_9SACH|nr:LADA_0F14576g1_1 [Lachancea dasiensis]
MDSPNIGAFNESLLNSPFGDVPMTPQRMNSIVEEDSISKDEVEPQKKPTVEETPQRPLSFYSAAGGNNSSNSLIANPSFSFGMGSNNIINDSSFPTNKRHSLKYVPGPKLPPQSSSRSKSPVRLDRTPSPERSKRRSSLVLDKPFNFSSSTLQPPSSSGSVARTSFRKGHRYKHSSVSMNFFQEPEVKIPLNIAKSLPIPDFSDLKSNIPWPRGHIQITLTALQVMSCVITFHLGHKKTWNNFITLSHFVLYDVIGSLAIILVENLSQFQVWTTGTITFPFGLNRIDLLSSFALAISLCFMGLDLFFHILEETIVLFVESTNHDHHEEIAPKIPHSHHASALLHTTDDTRLWYGVLAPNFVLSLLTLLMTFHSNSHNKFKAKNPLITCCYISYLVLYPWISKFTNSSDYLATGLLSIFIMTYGWRIAKWTSTILLLGFSTESLEGLILDNGTQESEGTHSRNAIKTMSNTLPLANSKLSSETVVAKHLEPGVVKSKIKESVEELAVFRANCQLSNDDLIIIKVNFDQYIVLMKIHMSGGSNDDELKLRTAVDKCIRKSLPLVETTIDVSRI